MTHEMFWRRMVRWLVDGVPDQVNLTTGHDRVEPGETVRFTAEVLDTAYVEVNDAHVEAHITSPSGKATDVPMEWTVEQDGEYGAVFNPDESGLYEIRVTATRDQKELGSNVMHLRVSAGDARVLRRGDARAAAEADRRGNRRPVLHGGQRGVAARSDQLQRTRRDRRRRARTVGHAGAAHAAARPGGRRVGVSAARGGWRDGRRSSVVGSLVRLRHCCVCRALWRARARGGAGLAHPRRHRRRRATRRTPSSSTSGRRRSSTRRRRRTACPTRTSRIWPRSPRPTPRASAAARRARR